MKSKFNLGFSALAFTSLSLVLATVAQASTKMICKEAQFHEFQTMHGEEYELEVLPNKKFVVTNSSGDRELLTQTSENTWRSKLDTRLEIEIHNGRTTYTLYAPTAWAESDSEEAIFNCKAP